MKKYRKLWKRYRRRRCLCCLRCLRCRRCRRCLRCRCRSQIVQQVLGSPEAKRKCSAYVQPPEEEYGYIFSNNCVCPLPYNVGLFCKCICVLLVCFVLEIDILNVCIEFCVIFYIYEQILNIVFTCFEKCPRSVNKFHTNYWF